MSLRLTTGFCSGMSLKSASEGTRPTSGKVRAAVMNSIQLRLADARVLDGFSGSGAVGIEAVSRGAKSATFIESGKEALGFLRANLAEVDRRAKNAKKDLVLRLESQAMSKTLPLLKDKSFDLLWFDPPYAILSQEWAAIAKELDRLADDDALVIVESDEAGAKFLEDWQKSSPWELQKQKSYGIIHVSFFERRGGEDE